MRFGHYAQRVRVWFVAIENEDSKKERSHYPVGLIFRTAYQPQFDIQVLILKVAFSLSLNSIFFCSGFI